MPIPAPQYQQLESQLDDLGVAWVLTGDPHTASGLEVLGLTPGDITPNLNPEFVERVYPEYSPTPISQKLRGYSPTVDIPLVWGDPEVYAKVNPLGMKAGGHTSPQDITYTSLVLVPDNEFQDEWAYDGTTWTYPVDGPSHAVWFHKGFFSGAFPTFGSLSTENKNRTGTVPYTAVLSDSPDWPEGTKAFVIGNPLDHGVTNLAI